MRGLLADDDQDFDEAEASSFDAKDSFDSDFGRESAEDNDEEQEGKRKKNEIDEDALLAKQEKQEATKKKVKFA